jgi:hypothetical protein
MMATRETLLVRFSGRTELWNMWRDFDIDARFRPSPIPIVVKVETPEEERAIGVAGNLGLPLSGGE